MGRFCAGGVNWEYMAGFPIRELLLKSKAQFEKFNLKSMPPGCAIVVPGFE